MLEEIVQANSETVSEILPNILMYLSLEKSL